jgi:3-oxoacyl-[acyl-carrier protein] reductase
MKSNAKTALVTGASRGIGLAIALDLARQGYNLGIVSRSHADIEAAAQQISREYPSAQVLYDSCDVTDGERALRFVEKIRDELGGITVLVNKAGECTAGTSDVPLDVAARMLEVNYLSAVRFVQAVIPEMKTARSGHIFNIASICGVSAFAEVGGYCASKFALVGYSEALALELEPFGLRVTALCPSWVNTRMAIASPIAPGEMIQPEDLAASVRFVLSLNPSVRIRQLVLHCE